jgi:hypothetical protein
LPFLTPISIPGDSTSLAVTYRISASFPANIHGVSRLNKGQKKDAGQTQGEKGQKEKRKRRLNEA